jgi:hypothetical protein
MPKRRSDRQCRERWKNYLAPGLNQGPWTKAEDRLLVEKFRQFGPKWAQIILSFPHRSNIDVKNRWKGIKTLAEIEEPLGEVVRHSPSIVEEADDQPQETPAEFLDENFYWLGSP